MSSERRIWILARIAVAAVWLYNGLWHKLLAPAGRHTEIVASVPLPQWLTQAALLGLGLAETVLAVLILIGFQPRLIWWLQCILLLGMNGAGLCFAAEQIPDPVAMILGNLLLLTLAWLLAEHLRDRTGT